MRQYGEIEGPYVLQMDACKCLANGVDRFNEYMGREAIRVIFRGRDEEDPKARCAGRPWRGGRGHLGNLGRGHRKTAKGRHDSTHGRTIRGAGPSGEPPIVRPERRTRPPSFRCFSRRSQNAIASIQFSHVHWKHPWNLVDP